MNSRYWKCPKCDSDLVGGLIFDTFMKELNDEQKALEVTRMYGATKTTGRWRREIGIERLGEAFISQYKCPDCGAVWDRFTGKVTGI